MVSSSRQSTGICGGIRKHACLHVCVCVIVTQRIDISWMLPDFPFSSFFFCPTITTIQNYNPHCFERGKGHPSQKRSHSLSSSSSSSSCAKLPDTQEEGRIIVRTVDGTTVVRLTFFPMFCTRISSKYYIYTYIHTYMYIHTDKEKKNTNQRKPSTTVEKRTTHTQRYEE
jgi:hypothetical protein